MKFNNYQVIILEPSILLALAKLKKKKSVISLVWFPNFMQIITIFYNYQFYVDQASPKQSVAEDHKHLTLHQGFNPRLMENS